MSEALISFPESAWCWFLGGNYIVLGYTGFSSSSGYSDRHSYSLADLQPAEHSRWMASFGGRQLEWVLLVPLVGVPDWDLSVQVAVDSSGNNLLGAYWGLSTFLDNANTNDLANHRCNIPLVVFWDTPYSV